MAEPLPPALKVPEVSRFINRANQLRSVMPAIAYWCEYHAVNNIVSKSLHTTDDDCFNFTKTLLERLEATKTERPDDDAIMDNVAGQAYVEQFAQQTFSRAERTMRANKVTRQTADTFDAAATFFDLTHEWGSPDPETLQKIKFAKWNAARILKAIRESRDPNESNPAVQQEEAPEALDPDDPDVQEISNPNKPRPVSVEDTPDAGDMPLPPAAHEGYFPPPPVSPPPTESFVPSPLSHDPGPTPVVGMPPPPTQFSSATQVPPQPSPHIPTKLPEQFTPQPEHSPVSSPSAPAPWTAPSPVNVNTPPVGPPQPVVPTYAPTPAPALVATPVAASAAQSAGLTQHVKDINQAQKHAKWAISALNFEDVPTAVKELQAALAMLGAR